MSGFEVFNMTNETSVEKREKLNIQCAYRVLPPVGYCCHCAAMDAGSAIASRATTTAHDKAPRRRTLEAMGCMVRELQPDTRQSLLPCSIYVPCRRRRNKSRLRDSCQPSEKTQRKSHDECDDVKNYQRITELLDN